MYQKDLAAVISFKEWLLGALLCLAIAAAFVTACGSGVAVASASGVPGALDDAGQRATRASARTLAAMRTTGDIGLTSVLPGQPAAFRIRVEAMTTCEGSVVYGSKAGTAKPTTALDRSFASTAEELSWTWITPPDISHSGGYVSMMCGEESIRVFFGIGAPEIGLLPAQQPMTAHQP